jgi:hypothetical protein
MTWFRTLLWLNIRRSAGALITLALWIAVALWLELQGGLAFHLSRFGPPLPFGSHLLPASLLLLLALLGGLGAILLLLDTFAAERMGSLMLLSPPPGWLHMLSRWLVSLATELVFAVVLALLLWAALLPARPELPLLFALGVLATLTFVAPLLAALLLLRQYLASFRRRTVALGSVTLRVDLAALLLGVLGLLQLGHWALVSYAATARLWVWKIPLSALGVRSAALGSWLRVPLAPAAAALLISAALLALAGWLRDEVEL